ncbi:MAG: linear amide C-N hydrolase, partial [Acidaminococcaceae bacterium]
MKLVKWSGVFLLMLVLFLFMTGKTFACTEIYLSSEGASSGISARNFDFMDGRGFIKYSPAGVQNSSQLANDKNEVLTWKSKYASLSFNSFFDQIGAEKGSTFIVAGIDGINTEGLKVGTYFSDAAAFSAVKNAKVLDVGMVMQYLLDNFQSVDEVSADLTSGKYNVISLPTQELEIKPHFFLHDAQGKSAIIEFLNGKVKVVKNPDIPVLTNSSYAESREQLKLYQGFGGEKPIPGGKESQERFVRAAYYWKQLPKVDSAVEGIRDGFSLMQLPAVSPGFSEGQTQWTIITDIKAKKIYFRTFNNPDVAFIDLDKIAKAAKTSSDIDLLRTDLGGDISKMFSVSEEFCPESVPAAPDYADKKNWAELPPSGNEKTVDVFFVHPTKYFFPNTWNESIEFGRQNAKVTGSM